MRALPLKLLRDLRNMAGQTLAVALVMACGLAMMIMARSLVFSLEQTRNAYYERNRFADLFADLKRAPNALRATMREIDGVATIETRVTGRLTLDLPGMREPADGTVISIPDDRPQALHLLTMRTGRLPRSENRGEVLVGEAFALAHGLRPGHTLAAIIRGRRQVLTIVGIALSPEFVFEARPGDTLPDNRRFGIFWMTERELSVALDLDGAFNSVLADVAPGQDPAAVVAELDRVLAPYGGLGASGRKDHPSAVRLDDELRVLRALAVAFPAAFLSIAAFMCSAVLTRVVRLQREQIAQLKAFGYSAREVGWHYLQFALVIVAAGLLAGTGAGFWLGTGVVSVYHQFFRFPELHFQPDLAALGSAAVASLFAAVLGVLGAVCQAMRLAPADAMRPEPPAEFRASFLERLGLTRLVGPSTRMALRNLERKPWQAAFTALGLALATAIPIIPGAMRDGIDHLLTFEWDARQRQDVTVALIEPGSAAAFGELSALPGVLAAEPFRSVPARLRFGHRSRRLSVTGLPRETSLNRLLDTHGQPVPLPPEGLLISAKLAETLGASPGDRILLEIQEGARPVREAVIHGLIVDYAGVAAYMEIEALRRLLREGGTVNGAYLQVDDRHRDALLERVKETPRVAALLITSAVRESFRKTTAQTISLIQTMYFSFAVVVAFGVVYNSARIALFERSRDLATLRVIGFTHAEVATVLIGELGILLVLALPVGLLLGSGMAAGIIGTVNTETVRLPLVLTSRTFATAILVVVVSAAISFAMVGRKLRHLDLIGVLKARD